MSTAQSLQLMKGMRINMEKKDDNRKKEKSGYTVGTSLVLVTFVLLALVVFATLSYSQAKADYNLSENAADNTSAYYDAYERAQIRLSEVSEKIAAIKKEASGDKVFFDNLSKIFENSDITFSQMDNEYYLEYSENITDSRVLEVQIKVCGYKETETYIITKWATNFTSKEEPEGEMHLIF